MSESISADELQGEESGQDSESPSSPRDLESDSPHKAEGIGERVNSINCPDSPASAVLSSRELWQLFDAIGTEMIVTRRGRYGLFLHAIKCTDCGWRLKVPVFVLSDGGSPLHNGCGSVCLSVRSGETLGTIPPSWPVITTAALLWPSSPPQSGSGLWSYCRGQCN